PCPHGREHQPSTNAKRSARALPGHVQREAPSLIRTKATLSSGARSKLRALTPLTRSSEAGKESNAAACAHLGGEGPDGRRRAPPDALTDRARDHRGESGHDPGRARGNPDARRPARPAPTPPRRGTSRP